MVQGQAGQQMRGCRIAASFLLKRGEFGGNVTVQMHDRAWRARYSVRRPTLAVQPEPRNLRRPPRASAAVQAGLPQYIVALVAAQVWACSNQHSLSYFMVLLILCWDSLPWGAWSPAMRALCEKEPLSIPICSVRNFSLASPHQLRDMAQHNSAQGGT